MHTHTKEKRAGFTSKTKLTVEEAQTEIMRVKSHLVSVLAKEWKDKTCHGLLLLAAADALDDLLLNLEKDNNEAVPPVLQELKATLERVRAEVWAPRCCVQVED